MHPETKIHFSFGKHVVLPGKITAIEQDARSFYLSRDGAQPIYFIEGDGYKDEFESIQRLMSEGRSFVDTLVNSWSVINRGRSATPQEINGEVESMMDKARKDFRYAEYLMIDRLSRSVPLVYCGETYQRGNEKIFTKDQDQTRFSIESLERHLKSGNIKKAVLETRNKIHMGRYFRGQRDSLIADQIIQSAETADRPTSVFVRYGVQHYSLVDRVRNRGIVDVSVVSDVVDMPSFLWEDYIAQSDEGQLDFSDEQMRLIILDLLVGSVITYSQTIESLGSGEQIHNKIKELSPDQVNGLLREFSRKSSVEILASFR